MKPSIREALAVEVNPADFETFRAFMAEYHEKIKSIIRHHGGETTFPKVWDTTLKALPPANRLVFVYMQLLSEIMWDGLALSLYNADGAEIRRYREMIQLAESVFLKERFEKAVALYRRKHGFRDPNSFSGIWEIFKRQWVDPETFFEKFYEDENIKSIDSIGEEIDNWDAEDIEKAYARLSAG